jgi:hypothetical protein
LNVVAYRGRRDLGRLRTFADATVTLTLHDANNQVVESRTATTNAYGSAAGEFTIPAGRALGRWRIDSSIPGSAAVQVEEYKRPTFEGPLEGIRRPPSRLNDPQLRRLGALHHPPGLERQRAAGQCCARRVSVVVVGWEATFRGGRAADQQVIAQGQTALDADGVHRHAGGRSSASEKTPPR